MTNKITQSLKQTIKNFEDSLGGLERHNFNRAKYRSWTDFNGMFQSTNGVKNDIVYLYKVPVLNVDANIGITFNMFSDYSKKELLPIDEQTVQFSYCLNIKENRQHNIPKDPIYSEVFSIEEARFILKSIRKAFLQDFKPYESSIEEFLEIFDEYVFNSTKTDLPKRLESALYFIKDDKENALSLKEKADMAYSDYKDSEEQVKLDLLNSPEQKRIKQLEDELFIAKKELDKKKTLLYAQYQVNEKGTHYLSCHSKSAKAHKSLKDLIVSTMKKFAIPKRLKDKLEK